MIKSIHEILYVNMHIPTYVTYRISFPKVKACITVSLSTCQVKTSNLLVSGKQFYMELSWPEGWGSKGTTSMLLHSSRCRDMITSGVGLSAAPFKLKDCDLWYVGEKELMKGKRS